MLKAVEAPLSGHPDKICDLLVESVVDEYLRRDMNSTFDIQALGSNGMVMVGGVVESKADFDVSEIAQAAYAGVGYDVPVELFVNLERPSPQSMRSSNSQRSPDGIARGVVGGASGTAIVYGYATKETRELMPKAVVYAHLLARRIDDLRRSDQSFAWLRPDGKVQLVLDGDRMATVTVIVEHAADMELNHVQALLLEQAVKPVLGDVAGLKVNINPAGPFTRGGFALSAGVSGRKTLSDTYGGLLPHGGAVMVGKDPLKPSRSGAYMARFAARELVQEGIAANVLISVVYGLGQDQPLALSARGGDGKDLSEIVKQRFDFRPEAIVERFNLRRPIYATCVNHGVFGRSGVPWEE